jgi:hypothetical protein
MTPHCWRLLRRHKTAPNNTCRLADRHSGAAALPPRECSGAGHPNQHTLEYCSLRVDMWQQACARLHGPACTASSREQGWCMAHPGSSRSLIFSDVHTFTCTGVRDPVHPLCRPLLQRTPRRQLHCSVSPQAAALAPRCLQLATIATPPLCLLLPCLPVGQATKARTSWPLRKPACLHLR